MVEMKAVGRKNLKKLKEFMEEKNIDVILLSNSDVNVRYFSNFFGSCVLVITDKRILFTNSLEFERAKKQADVERIVNVKDFNYSYGEAIKRILGKIKRIGIVKSRFTLKFYENLKKRLKVEFINVENFLNELRAVKFKEEIKLLKKSAKIADSGIKIIEETLTEVSKGRKIKERELASRLEEHLKKKGAEGLAFETLVASAQRSSFPHPYPPASNQLIKKGLGYVDFGAVYKGYHSDITVPFVIGKINQEQKKIIKITEEAYNLALNSIQIDLPTWKLYEKIEKFLNLKGFELKHGLGHGLGLTIHDSPSISLKPKDKMQLKEWKETKFKENMVFTIEPGVYSNQGCRIENDILLTRKGIKVLTSSRLIEA